MQIIQLNLDVKARAKIIKLQVHCIYEFSRVIESS